MCGGSDTSATYVRIPKLRAFIDLGKKLYKSLEVIILWNVK